MFTAKAVPQKKILRFGDDRGYIVVETVGAFIPFVLLVVSILSLVNIVTVQARMHYAITQAANTLSMYSYALEVMGIADKLIALDENAYEVAEQANAMRNEINAVLSGIESFSNLGSAMDNAEAAANRALGWGEEVMGDPKGVLQLLLNYGVNEARNHAFEQMARPLVGRFLANGGMTGDEYLRSVGVVKFAKNKPDVEGLAALEFHDWYNMGIGNSVLIDKDGNVIITVHYEIEYTFGALRLPFRPTLKITQTAVTKAWLGGSGEGYVDNG